MVTIGCSFEACLMSLTCKYEILENPMSTVGAPTLLIINIARYKASLAMYKVFSELALRKKYFVSDQNRNPVPGIHCQRYAASSLIISRYG